MQLIVSLSDCKSRIGILLRPVPLLAEQVFPTWGKQPDMVSSRKLSKEPIISGGGCLIFIQEWVYQQSQNVDEADCCFRRGK